MFYIRVQLSILAILATLSPAAHGSQLPWEQSPIYLRENPTSETGSFMDRIFGTPELEMPTEAQPQAAPIGTQSPEAEAQNQLADIMPGFLSSNSLGEWAATPSYFGIGGIPPSPVLVDPFTSMELNKLLFNPADPMFLPSTYFDNDPALKKAQTQEVGIVIE
jgi:hypothetical protein